MIRSGNADRIERLIGNQVAKIFYNLRLKTTATGSSFRAFQMRLIDIAEGSGLNLRNFQGIA